MTKKILSGALLFFCFQSAAAEQNYHRTIEWKTPVTEQITENDKVTLLHFENCTYTIKGTPQFNEVFYLGNQSFSNQAKIENVVTEVLAEQNLLHDIDQLTTQFQVTSTVVVETKKPSLNVSIFPFRRNASGQIEKLISFDIVFEASSNSTLRNGLPPAKTLATSSVLNSGTWYKISVSQDGIYKISYQFLKNIGLDPDVIDPHNIRIYGNGGGMLPLANSAFRYDDLQENAIYIEGEGDNVFNQSDYILFYGQSPVRWTYNPSSCNKFSHSNNLYTDNNYYFITADLGTGKRIQQRSSSAQSPTHTVTSFNDYQYHEADLTNLIKSGREWFGEAFDVINNSQSFNFSFPNINTSEQGNVRVQAAARSTISPPNLAVNVAGQSIGTILIPTVPNVYYLDYANTAEICNVFNPSLSSISAVFNFSNTSDASSIGWLNWVEINVRRYLDYSNSGSQMFFRDANSVGAGNVAKYVLSNATNTCKVWDVTDGTNVAEQQSTFNSGTLDFTLESDSLRQFLVFNGSQFLTPTFTSLVANQDLHALPQTDMIIVTNPKYINQSNDIADLHRQQDGLTVAVVTTDQVFNEFSSGKQDVAAIRDFMKMFYDRSIAPDIYPKYLLLMGDASYDPKDRLPNNTNDVVTFESDNSTNLSSSYNSDDFFGNLDASEGNWTASQLDVVDIAVGRLPVKSVDEAIGVVNKIKIYTSIETINTNPSTCGNEFESAFGDWRNIMAFAADDEDGNTHLNQADALADDTVRAKHPEFNVDKIYFDSYKQEVTSGGQRYPDARNALVDRVQRGALLVTYVGHGGELGLALERVLEVSDIQGWTNIKRLPAFLTATCEFSRPDDPSRTAAGEYVILNPNGGGIGLFTTTRLAYSSQNFTLARNFFSKLFDIRKTEIPTLGKVFKQTKQSYYSSINTRNFTLLGDPAVKMNFPKMKVYASAINSDTTLSIADTLRALSKVNVSGYVADASGNKINTFNGIIYPTVLDKIVTFYTLANDATSPATAFDLQKNALYRGKATVTNGDFNFSFIVPKDILFNYGKGKLSFYAYDGQTDANGYFDNVIVGGVDTSAAQDAVGPAVKIYLNDEQFAFGGTTDENPIFYAVVSDSSGMNTVGNGIGHDATLQLDGNPDKIFTVNDYYEADLNSYQSGKVKYNFKDLEEGNHNLRFKIWDVYNNSSDAYTEFVVASSAELALKHVLNWPNPFTTRTTFMFEHNKPCTDLKVQVQVYTVSGKLVKTINENVRTEGFLSRDIEWDGMDDYGDKIGKGVYVYRVKLKAPDGTSAEQFEKLVLLK